MKFDAASRLKSLEARKAAIAASQHLKRDWLDSVSWDLLATKRGIRLPGWSRSPTPIRLKRWHQSLEKETFEAVYGAKPSRIIALNPHVPLRAFVGQMLEREQGLA